PVKYVVICSDHGDHTGGNTAFPQGAIFIAHPTSKKTLEDQASNRRPDQTPIIIPTETVADKRVLKMGNTEIQILFLGRAHTGGDLSVYLPKEKVLFMSEAFLHRIFPAMRSAYPSEWVEAVKKAEKMDVTWYIPGHGFVDDPKSLKEELAVYRKAMETVITEATRLKKAGVPCAAPIPGRPANEQPPCEADAKANFGELNGWTLRQGQGATAIRKVWEEIEGKLK
ncbi:MAG: MBL fold metallo-hydrolase, partial [Phycisphaerales bacterium]|nr:MBL fold metallo-hydrolase [Phycisphaerales bacterium]